jgi:ATP-binding cassette subfamily F protein 3
MPVATGSRLAKSFGAEQVFQDVTFEIQDRDRIAFVGVNGSGKTTLLRTIAGLERADSGTVSFASGVRVGYLSQEVTFPSDLTLRQYVLSAFQRLVQIESDLHRVETQLAAAPAATAEAALLVRHANLLHEYEYGGGYTYLNRVHEVLAGLGITEDRLDQPLSSFSAGQRTRAALAHLLLTDEDLLLLDEPTNHLDLAATEWLEDFLTLSKAAIVVVSHDRYFLDQVATRTWELSFGQLDQYAGNYSRFAGQRAVRRERQQKEYEAQQAYIARTEAFIRRYRAGQRSRQARGRQKQLNRMERVASVRDAGQIRMEIQSTLRSGEIVLALEDVAVAASARPGRGVRQQPGSPFMIEAPREQHVSPGDVLFSCPSVELRRGERAAIIGPNGSGKTTFLRVITGEIEPAAGRLFLGYGVQMAYYAQAHEQLNMASTVMGEILSTKPMGEEQARTYLGRFLFTGDDAFKPVTALSGGERSRLALAKMALSNANFLLLDEPTNHLDIYSREALEATLDQFGGTILFVSHDRYLIDGLATQVWEIAEGRLRAHRGDWGDFLAERERERERERAQQAARVEAARAAGAARQSSVTSRAITKAAAARRQQLERIEEHVASLTERLRQTEHELADASSIADAATIADLGHRHQAISAELAQAEDAWLTLHEEEERAATEQGRLAAAAPRT